MSIILLQFLLGVVFLTLVYLHLTKKNFGAVMAYGLQSMVIVIILLNSFFESRSLLLLVSILVTLLVKVILAPIFFTNFIKKNKMTFAVSNHFKTPLTLVIIAIFTAIAHSQPLLPLTNIIPDHHILLSLALSEIFLAIFLIINQKGALSQAIGILSLENSILTFAVFAGLEQSPTLQLGIIFDILIWSVIATVFVSMIYRHFGSLDTSLMKGLKE